MAPEVTTTTAGDQPQPKKGFAWGKLLVALLVVGGLIALFKVLPMKEWIESFKTWVKAQGALGYVIFGAVYIGASLIPGGPAALLTLAAGAIYGVVTGTVLVSIASTSAATLAFLLARGVFQKRVQAMAAGNPTFGSLNKAIEKEGARIVALVRLSPVFPFTFINYAFGLTPLKLGPYVLASWIAMLPGTLAYVYLGAAVGDVAAGGGVAEKVALGLTQKQLINVGLSIAAVIATVFIARIAAKAIKSAGVGESGAPGAGT